MADGRCRPIFDFGMFLEQGDNISAGSTFCVQKTGDEESDHENERRRKMKRPWQVTMVVVTIVLGTLLNAEAEPSRAAKKQHADTNNDGKVSVKEFKVEQEFTRAKRAEVDKAWEKKADKNDNGTVDPGERAIAARKKYLAERSEVDKAWEEKADKNDDGTVGKMELKQHRAKVMDKNGDGTVDKVERKAWWKKRRSKANTALEKKFDADGDGYINGDEAKTLLRAKLRRINASGKARVDSDIEEEFDANGDGYLSREEAKAMKEAMGE